ncbi:acyl carrier protein [Desulforhabdus amnigena]|jgi:acyl carrier protein|uniref:Carrier domain-containing protein n=1 Tax=Desulforhabdus amnigena TaxID=40218 RepID=A0A9W6D565_9BACT|nr:phosphopantetheine-binding protein [Desulforhabdus amnigena]NLJ28426.1 acyl carrier protein [Deltaproteobacteria bacterium]GLI33446.1 hypothetical protein DAMNIGENAA_08790 [Desulforhabdus amnigena]
MEEQIKGVVLTVIKKIAPEANLDHLKPNKSFRDQFDFDSIDFLNFALALQEKFAVKIPENDYPKLATLDGCIEYLKSKISAEVSARLLR